MPGYPHLDTQPDDGDDVGRVLHEDDPRADGNLTEAEYLATYNDPDTEPIHRIPDEVLEQVAREVGDDGD